jgi:voltage-gated potassium channel
MGVVRPGFCRPFCASSAGYILRHWLDVLIIALPLLRGLRLLRLASLLAVLNRHAASGLQGKGAIYVIGGSSLLAFCAALAVLDAERRNHDASITDFGDTMWWAITTMTTSVTGTNTPRLVQAGSSQAS